MNLIVISLILLFTDIIEYSCGPIPKITAIHKPRKPLKYFKDSFDRFGDDLSAFILQFLPLKEKMRFECLDWNVKNNIYLRHSALLINGDLISRLRNIPNIEKHTKCIPSINWEGFGIMMRKLKNVNRVYFRNMEFIEILRNLDHMITLTKSEFNTFFLYINPECQKLVHCDFAYLKYLRHTWVPFAQKNLKSLKSIFNLYTFHPKELSILHNFKELTTIQFNTHYSMVLDNAPCLDDKLHFPKLKKLRFCYCCLHNEGLHSNENHSTDFPVKFIKANPQITFLKIINEIEFSHKLTTELDVFMKLKLEYFEGKFTFRKGLKDNSVLMRLSESFKKLKKLKLVIRIQIGKNMNELNNMNSIMKFFENLTELVTLDLKFSGTNSEFKQIDCFHFRNCSKLRKLSLHIDRINDYFENDVFKYCHIFMPMLQQLTVKRIKFNEKLIENFSQHKNLSKIYFSCLNMYEYQRCAIQLHRLKCKNSNIKSIVITYNDHYSSKLIQ